MVKLRFWLKVFINLFILIFLIILYFAYLKQF